MNRSTLTAGSARSGRRLKTRTLQYLLLGLAAAVSSAYAIQPDMSASKPLLRRAFLAPELDVHPALEATQQLRETMSRPAADAAPSRTPCRA